MQMNSWAFSQNAAADGSRYKKRSDGSTRMFGGYNYIMLGDMNQLPPIPASAALFIPPIEKSWAVRQALDILWSSVPDALNFFQELLVQSRIDDLFWDAFSQEC